MTGWDIAFVSVAVISLISVGVMAWVGLQMKQTMQTGQRRVQPAIREAQELAQHGKTMAEGAKARGMAMTTRVQAVTAKLKQRVETTRRIAGELKPHGSEGIGVAPARPLGVSHKAATLGDMARRITRVSAAARSAAQKNRDGAARGTE
jgi:hypothetical protein